MGGKRTPKRYKFPMLRGREITGFALAPLPALAPFILMFAAILFDQPDHRADVLWIIIQILLLGYGVTLLFGVPIHLVLRRKRLTKIGPYLALSVLSALLIAGLLALRQRLFGHVSANHPFPVHLWGRAGVGLALMLASAAALSASVFWAVAVREPQR